MFPPFKWKGLLRLSIGVGEKRRSVRIALGTLYNNEEVGLVRKLVPKGDSEAVICSYFTAYFQVWLGAV